LNWRCKFGGGMPGGGDVEKVTHVKEVAHVRAL